MIRPATLSRGALVVLLLTSGSTAFAAPVNQSDFRSDMRKLWEDHVTWTRVYIIDAVADLPSKSASAERLLQNQADIGGAISTFYGAPAGTKLTALLKDHIMIATEIIAAAKAGDAAKKDAAAARWGTNADEIATFLSGANPKNWPAADMKKHMRDHLDLT